MAWKTKKFIILPNGMSQHKDRIVKSESSTSSVLPSVSIINNFKDAGKKDQTNKMEVWNILCPPYVFISCNSGNAQ